MRAFVFVCGVAIVLSTACSEDRCLMNVICTGLTVTFEPPFETGRDERLTVDVETVEGRLSCHENSAGRLDCERGCPPDQECSRFVTSRENGTALESIFVANTPAKVTLRVSRGANLLGEQTFLPNYESTTLNTCAGTTDCRVARMTW